jgi:hypothetical protein
MAVNENLYNWMFKTYGIKPAEWYRNNPNAKPGANPFLPKGAYVPKAQKQQPTGLRGETLASVSPDIETRSIVEPAPQAASANLFQQYLNRLTPEQRKEIESEQLSEEDKREIGLYGEAKRQYEAQAKPAPQFPGVEFPSAKLGPNIAYMPNYGQYGGYFSRENLGYNLSSNLYSRYQKELDKYPVPDDVMTIGAVALRNNPEAAAMGYSGNSPDTLARLKAYDDAMAARENIFQTIYKDPLANAKYKSTADAPSRAAYRQQLIEMGFEIPLEQNYTYFERAATPEDYEVQQYGLENVGREDYRRQRQSAAIQKNIEILKQQAAAGNQASQEALRKIAPQEKGPRGEETLKERGPRGETMGDIASILPPAMTQGELYRDIQSRSGAKPGTKEYGELRDLQKEWIQRQKLKGAEAPAFDEQKARVATRAADEYRQRQAQTEDPFRSGAFG